MLSLKTLRGITLAAALVVTAAMLPVAQAQVSIGIGISVHVAPPALPVYVQPPLPAPGFIWTPGYWAWGDAGYYWVPGVWVRPPSAGVLWTPGYWGFAGGVYGWHAGYWGPHVGFYGGVNYGFGYGGIGFFGGEWRGGVFAYNSAVANFGAVHVANVYVNRTIVEQNTIVNNNHVAFNGGPGGINRAPSVEEQQFRQRKPLPADRQPDAAPDRCRYGSLAASLGQPGPSFHHRDVTPHRRIARLRNSTRPPSPSRPRIVRLARAITPIPVKPTRTSASPMVSAPVK